MVGLVPSVNTSGLGSLVVLRSVLPSLPGDTVCERLDSIISNDRVLLSELCLEALDVIALLLNTVLYADAPF
jgi:hypothetical protein